MNLSQTATLLAFAAAFDRRTVGDADVRAWQSVLAGLDFDEARTAVAEHYSSETRWIMPADILQRAKRHRANALQDFQYQPGHPDETPAQYLTRRRQQLAAVATGQRPAALPALPPGRRPELAGVGREIPALEPVRRGGPLSVACPQCRATVGAGCRTTKLRRRMADVHPARLDASRSTQ